MEEKGKECERVAPGSDYGDGRSIDSGSAEEIKKNVATDYGEYNRGKDRVRAQEALPGKGGGIGCLQSRG